MAVGGLLPMPAWVLGGDSVGVGAGGRRGEAIRLLWFGRFVGCARIRVLGSVLALPSLRGDTQGGSPLGSIPSGYWPSAFEGLWQWCVHQGLNGVVTGTQMRA